MLRGTRRLLDGLSVARSTAWQTERAAIRRLKGAERTAIRSHQLRLPEAAVAAETRAFLRTDIGCELATQVRRRSTVIDEVWRSAAAGSAVVNVGSGFCGRAAALGAELVGSGVTVVVELDKRRVVAAREAALAASGEGAGAETPAVRVMREACVLPVLPLDELLAHTADATALLFCVEGVLEYLSPACRCQLFDNITGVASAHAAALSSRLVFSVLHPSMHDAFDGTLAAGEDGNGSGSDGSKKKFGAWRLPLTPLHTLLNHLSKRLGWTVDSVTAVTPHCSVVVASFSSAGNLTTEPEEGRWGGIVRPPSPHTA
eukprot:Rhum_TRINITY_DN23306_c0_g1::Rhum_TRINITY_DN23306_c0_g1_i1::g.177673::m.177673